MQAQTQLHETGTHLFEIPQHVFLRSVGCRKKRIPCVCTDMKQNKSSASSLHILTSLHHLFEKETNILLSNRGAALVALHCT